MRRRKWMALTAVVTALMTCSGMAGYAAAEELAVIEEEASVVELPAEDVEEELPVVTEEETEELTDEEQTESVPVVTGEETADEAQEETGENQEETGDAQEEAAPTENGEENAAAEETESVPAEAAESEDGEYEYEEMFPSWNEDAPALQTLIGYVEDVTDEASPDYIPPVDRIATFDMDGTVYAELFPTYLEYYMMAWRILADPTFEPDEEMLEVARTIRDCSMDRVYPEDMPMQHAIQAARAYAGMTLTEFADYVTTFLLRDADGFEGMNLGEAFYLPIVEVVEYLQENDFKVYICSGSDRFLCRTLIEGMMDIPYENIIGMDVAVEATGQGETDGLDYVYSRGDAVVRTDRLLIKNLKMNKVAQIVRDIGRQPVLSFGNTSGDVSMHNYTLFDNPYRSAAFMLIADDDVRDYGNPEKGQELREKWEASGYNVISMRDDFRTIYGDDVVKTGSFRWMEELSEKSADSAEASVAEEAPAEAEADPAA